MANINVAGLIKDCDAAIQEKINAMDKVSGLRELLRFAVRAGEATEEQAEWIQETFPIQARKTNEERVAELEGQLARASAKLGA